MLCIETKFLLGISLAAVFKKKIKTTIRIPNYFFIRLWYLALKCRFPNTPVTEDSSYTRPRNIHNDIVSHSSWIGGGGGARTHKHECEQTIAAYEPGTRDDEGSSPN